jgi:hypothetical protein
MSIAHASAVAHFSPLKVAVVANVAAAIIVTGWTVPNTAETVAFMTAFLVAWNTWRASKNDKVVKDIHTLTNSAMGAQLKLNVTFAEQNAVKSKRIAAMTKEEGDIAAATADDVIVEQQRAIYQEHLVRQAKVDARA